MGVANQEGQLVAEGTASRGLMDAPRLEELYARHVGEAECLAYLLTGDPHLAEDVAQEAFVRLAGRFRHLRHAEAFGAYLRKTVVNLCRTHFRRARVERAYLRRERSAAPVWEPPPEAALGGDVIRAIRCLPYRQRAAVVLRYYEDLSEEQVAEALGASRRAVNSLVSRALASLRRDLGSEER
jgi:RNA polymerase sigma-70 factor (sigma-E family)